MICADNRDTWAYVYRPGIQPGFRFEFLLRDSGQLPASQPASILDERASE